MEGRITGAVADCRTGRSAVPTPTDRASNDDEPRPSTPARASRVATTATVMWATVSAIAGALTGWTVVGEPTAAIAVGATGSLAGAAAALDARTNRLPDRLTLGVLAAGVVAVTIDAAQGGQSGIAVLVGALSVALVGALLGAAPMLTVRLTRGLGMGDVKLAGALGVSLASAGWWAPLVAVAGASAAAGAVGRAARRTALPLGPFLVGGWCATLVTSPLLEGIWR